MAPHQLQQAPWFSAQPGRQHTGQHWFFPGRPGASAASDPEQKKTREMLVTPAEGWQRWPKRCAMSCWSIGSPEKSLEGGAVSSPGTK